MTDQSLGRGKFAGLLLLLQGLLLILFVVFGGYSDELLPDGENETKTTSKYSIFEDLHVMLFAGFELLLTFLRKYEFSAMGYNFISALVIEWSTIMQGFFEMHSNKISIGLESQSYSILLTTATFCCHVGKQELRLWFLISFTQEYTSVCVQQRKDKRSKWKKQNWRKY